ncbi:MAG TPA: DUF998 domain-containing protein [Bryobacteraceae bacterium]|nr:DUF998 domain-containing protein [Bryobacteraceae bacterium]
MDIVANQGVVAAPIAPAATIAIGATVVSLATLLLLHALSPEFAPSWRMVSEYANGRYPWLLTLVFFGWAVSSFALIPALWPLSTTTLGKVGLVFLALAGVGQTMGGLFDINHKLHGPAALIGIPSLCIAAVLVTMALSRRAGVAAPPVWSAHLPWISFALMLGAFAMFVSALKSAGVDVTAQATPLSQLPEGVSGYVGWANRLLFASTYLWVTLAALSVLRGVRES